MKPVIELVLSLQDRGVRIWIENEQLRCCAPPNAVLREELEKLRAYRDQVTALIPKLKALQGVPLSPRGELSEVPLTPVQQMPLYLVNVQHPRIPIALRVYGALDIDCLQRSVDHLVRRHESLRTRIPRSTRPIQIIDSGTRFGLESIDVSHDFAAATHSVPPAIQDFADVRIHLSVGPLFDCKIFRLAEDHHVLVISIDHIISDGISIYILFEELWSLYGQALSGHELFLTPLPLQFADFAIWLERIGPLWHEVHGPFWKEHLKSAPCLHTPAGMTDERSHNSFGDTTVSFGNRITTAIREFSDRWKGSPALIVLAAYVAAISRWFNQTDLTVVLIDNGRHSSDLTRSVGLFSSFLYLRLETSPNQTFLDLLDHVIAEFSSALRHRDFGLVPSIVPGVPHDIGFNWLVANYDHLGPKAGMQGVTDAAHKFLGEIRTQTFPLSPSGGAIENDAPFDERSQFGLFMTCSKTDRSSTDLRAYILYRTSFFSSKSIEAFATMLRSMLEAGIRSPQLPLWDQISDVERLT